MKKIIRTKMQATGGITAEERLLLQEHSKKWIAIALKTGRVNRPAITSAIEDLYRDSNLTKPRVVVVQSPRMMVIVGAIASAWWGTRAATYDATYAATAAATNDATRVATAAATAAATNDATNDATRDATAAATYDATAAATYAATAAATRAATRAATCAFTRDATYASTYASTDASTAAATRDATRDATYASTAAATLAATDAFTDASIAASIAASTAATDGIVLLAETFGVAITSVIAELSKWYDRHQGGNMWAHYDCYLSAWRDVMGLDLRCFEKYASWEESALNGGSRYMHEKFCLVCEFPDQINQDDNNLPHCESGPSLSWMDGFAVWHIHGIAVDEQIVMRPHTQTVEQINGETNADVRAVRIERFGWARYLRESKAECIDHGRNAISNTDEALYLLADGTKRFVAGCTTAKLVTMGVPSEIETCEQAQLWLAGGKKWNLIAAT
jgi:hypothetical protein